MTELRVEMSECRRDLLWDRPVDGKFEKIKNELLAMKRVLFDRGALTAAKLPF